jgi:mono/diheme cytochrome c family protein
MRRAAIVVLGVLGAAVALAQSPPASVWDGAYTEDQAKRGDSVYKKECASCHGASLEGGGDAGPLVGPAFTSNWNGVTVGDLFDRIRVSMPQNRPGTLSRQQIADVLAYILGANKFPAGKGELAAESERLKLIRFEVTRP